MMPDANSANYKLVTYRTAQGPRAGILLGERVYDAATLTSDERDTSLVGMLEDWPAATDRIASTLPGRDEAPWTPFATLELLAPLPVPGAVYAAGANYSDHAAEMARATGAPLDPTKGLRSWHFLKSSRSITGDDAIVAIPTGSLKLDWEVELAAVIGRKGHDIALEDALDHVAGYSVAIDFSARDLSRRSDHRQDSPFYFDWLAHKSFDGACPLGPWLTPAWQVPDPQQISLELKVNGTVKQSALTSLMIFSVAEQIRDISSRITLWPGDIILTGTPAGVGSARGEFLKSGDVVVARADTLGKLVCTMA